MKHELKTWKPFFKSVWDCQKTFEVRKDDRGFKTGDRLILQEYDAELKTYTGREIIADVGYVLHGGKFGIEAGYCVLGLSRTLNLPTPKPSPEN